MRITTYHLRTTLLLLPLYLLLVACDEVVAPDIAEIDPVSAGYFDAPHFTAATNPTLPKLYFAGERFDPFCPEVAPFSMKPYADGYLLTALNPQHALSLSGDPCWAAYLRCNARCRAIPHPYVRMGCWGACTLALGVCRAK